jgi:NDP-sugar pyrophosphorylase family protein
MSVLPFEAIVMAGGRGERLHPLTADCPKPLLPLAGQPIVGYTIKRLRDAGVKNFTFCVNYMAEQIEAHFGNGEAWRAEFEYLLEKEPLGTIGGAALKENFRYEDLLVINGDLLTTIHFDRFYAFYLEEDAHLAIATIPYRVNLPYGILELDSDQVVQGVREKPTFTYRINTGIYMMRRELLDLIPRNTRFDAIELIEVALDKGLKVVSYPLHDYWIDIGQIEDYRKAQEDILFLDL